MLTYNELGKNGRFGNQLFQIASTIGIAKKFGYEFVFPKWEYQDWFKNELPVIDFEIDRVMDMPLEFIHSDFILPDNFSLYGYMQSEKYFEDCKETIRHYFEFKNNPYIDSAGICLHVRRGDYDGKHLTLLGSDYYEKALLMMPELPIFVFSDDIIKAKNLLGNSHTYLGWGSDIEQFMFMTSFNYFIIANSSFSWWAQWLAKNRKQVIAPAEWFGTSSSFKSKDIYTNEMIII